MAPTVTVLCIVCRHRETVPLTETPPPGCSKCGGPLAVVAAQVEPASSPGEAIGSRNVETLEREAPHLLAPSSRLEAGDHDA